LCLIRPIIKDEGGFEPFDKSGRPNFVLVDITSEEYLLEKALRNEKNIKACRWYVAPTQISVKSERKSTEVVTENDQSNNDIKMKANTKTKEDDEQKEIDEKEEDREDDDDFNDDEGENDDNIDENYNLFDTDFESAQDVVLM
jgi:hypothetical protein